MLAVIEKISSSEDFSAMENNMAAIQAVWRSERDNTPTMKMNRWLVCIGIIALITLASCQQPKAPATPFPPQVNPTPSTQSLTPTQTSPPTPTLTLVTPPPPESSIISESLTSPDGQWIAETSFEFLEGGAAFRVKLVVQRFDQSVEWVPVDYTQQGIGYVYPAIRYWSPDSRHFYYFNMPTPDGCGDFYPEEDQWVGLDVADGSLSTLSLPQGRGHTMSPDGGTIIYATSVPPFEIRFRDILSGIEKSLPLPPSSDPEQEVQAGGWVWSPDGSSVALSVAYGDSCADRTKLSFAVVRIDDLTNPTLVPLVEHNTKLIRLIDWETLDRILVKDWNGYSWWMDSRDGQPAPSPTAPTNHSLEPTWQSWGVGRLRDFYGGMVNKGVPAPPRETQAVWSHKVYNIRN